MNNKLQEIVLVVDDSPESLGMLNIALNKQGYTALVALSGMQALSIVEKIEPDVILLDAIMPELDGFKTCKRLKQVLPNTPVIFMTGLTDVEDVVRGFEAGGSDYVTKPMNPDEVIARIKTHIQTANLTLSAQNALDNAGSNVFCVTNEGRLSWATPHVHELVEAVAGNDKVPWATLATHISQWIKGDTATTLNIDCFDGPLEISYENEQKSLHLLRIKETKQQKTPADLQQNLPITKRESEVLYWVSYAKTSWEISQILDMSPRTVNKHLQQIYKKLGVDNRTAAAAISIRILES